MSRQTYAARMAAALLMATALQCSAQLHGPDVDATELNLRIFYAHAVHAVTITPLSATMQTCAGCRSERMTVPINVTAEKGLLHVVGNAPLSKVFLDGGLRISGTDTAGDAVHAEAAGRWRISAAGDELRIVVAIPSEKYVLAALAAEAAPDEPMESLKALAIVIRTFALENLGRHAAQGYDLCDSTHCQALHLGSVRAEIYEAEQATLGETLYFAGQRAQVYFTQNCGGVTESAHNAWGKDTPYLTSHIDPYCVRRGPTVWHAGIDIVQMSDVLRRNGWQPPNKITEAHVVQRTASGRAAMIEFKGQGRPLRISASSLRFALDRSLGWQQVRSDGYDVTLQDGKLLFTGTGYGHGVGLCQAGAWQMASTGSDAAAILKFYFPGTTIRVTPQDAGLQTYRAQGWLLTTVDAQHVKEVMAAGNDAWQKSNAMLPGGNGIAPRVTLAPDTELFRQASGAPGWMLGVTVGDRIWMQPYAICARSGGVEKLLLHEMLHVRVEHEATAKAPLWLREGLVEVLAENASPSVPLQENLQAIENELLHPTGLQQSQRAHQQAAAMVRRCIARYGLDAVRRWLSSGPPAEFAFNKQAVSSESSRYQSATSRR